MGIDVTTRVPDGGNGFKPIEEGDKPRIAYKGIDGTWKEYSISRSENGEYLLDDLSTENREAYKVALLERGEEFFFDIPDDEKYKVQAYYNNEFSKVDVFHGYTDMNFEPDKPYHCGILFIDKDGDGFFNFDVSNGRPLDDKGVVYPYQYFEELNDEQFEQKVEELHEGKFLGIFPRNSEKINEQENEMRENYLSLEQRSYDTYNQMLEYFDQVESIRQRDYKAILSSYVIKYMDMYNDHIEDVPESYKKEVYEEIYQRSYNQ